ncbi:SMP-30/gluconolactonase/LRE family protein [Cognatishimia activa]|uniref:ATP/GTP-binding protein n=1 Tax=Cognatishimia activa TaxID=1715691 RepID=A0A0P1J952_9RHOB|nr:hypothetical protein [Cognatishimia activa]CUI66381.1 hypothetical protein TA5113_01083 [Cognatishimia activa]CUK26446.1 hypothetical protein TA5114_02256 [Cognatishimia activa]
MIRLTLATLLLATSAQAWEATGFELPESVLPDPSKGQLYVSNMVDSPFEPDGNGYISRLSMDGKVLDMKWATGMHSPKGMALFGDHLVVADLNALHFVDRKTGEITKTLTPEGIGLFNDVTASGDRVWVSDMLTGVIWSYDGETLAPFYQDAALPHPNGLWTDGLSLVVGHWGPGMKPDFSTDAPGDLLSIDLATKEATQIYPELANIDGVAKIGDSYIANDWITGEIFKVTDGTSELLLSAPASTADIGVFGNTIYLPIMMEGRITTFEMGTTTN